MAYTTTDLLADVKLRGFLAQGSTLTDSALCTLATQALRSWVYPWLVSLREDYYIRSVDVPLESGKVAYAIPIDAAGDAIRDLHIVDATGNTVTRIARLELEELTLFEQSTTSDMPVAFRLQGRNIVLTPTPSASGWVMRVYYVSRPPKLVTISTTGQSGTPIVNTAGLNAVICNPTTSLPFGSNTICDIVRGVPPYDVIDSGITIFAANIDVTFTRPLSESATSYIDDGRGTQAYLCLQAESCVVPLPEELTQALVSAVCARVSQAQGDRNGAASYMAEMQAEMASVTALLAPRDQGQPHIILDKSGLWLSGGG